MTGLSAVSVENAASVLHAKVPVVSLPACLLTLVLLMALAAAIC